ncbi:MAG: WG repeat-containing protein [Prosthecobacter sp.]
MKTSSAHKLRTGLFAALSLLLLLDAAHAHSPSFSEGLVHAQDPATKKWGYLNKKGEWALPPKFDEAHEFKSGRAGVKQGDQTMFIDQSGKVAFISKWKVELWEGFHGGLLRIVEDGKQGYVDTSGKLSIAPEYDAAKFFSDDFAAVSKGGKWGFINTRGKVVVPLDWDAVGSFSEGLAWVSRERKTGFINETGGLQIPLQYSRANDFKNGHASVYEGVEKQNRVINAKGELLTSPNPKWTSWEIVGDDRISFAIDAANSITGKLLGIADSKGQVLVEPTWALMAIGSGFDSGLACAKLPGESRREWGETCYINRDGKVVIPYFDYSNWFEEGLAFASEGNKKGYIDTTGKFVFEMPK